MLRCVCCQGKELDHAVVELVQRCTASHGSAKLVLKQGRFWVQTADEQVMHAEGGHPLFWVCAEVDSSCRH